MNGRHGNSGGGGGSGARVHLHPMALLHIAIDGSGNLTWPPLHCQRSSSSRAKLQQRLLDAEGPRLQRH